MNVIPKLLDSIVSSKLACLIKEYIIEEQHGFQAGKSTVTNLAVFSNFCINNIEQGIQVDTIYTDFSKAFDRVNINILIKKLETIGFHSSLLNWITSYLSDRKQVVVIEKYTSRNINATSGVPQGSHCGPLLFILFINDITEKFSFSKCLIYADDLKLFAPISSFECCLSVQNDINKLTEWCRLNYLPLNISKCSVMSLYRCRSPIVYPYNISEVCVSRVSQIKDLGVTYDDKLSFSTHIEIMVSKAFSLLGFIKRNTKDFRDIGALKVLYFSLVRSVLEYASTIWCPKYAVYINRIESVQKSFTRFLAWKSGIWGTNPPSYDIRCLCFGIQKLSFRRDALCALFIRDVICYKINSPKLLSLIQIYAPERPLRIRNLLCIPPHRTNYGFNETVSNCINKFNFFNNATVDVSMSRDAFKNSIYIQELTRNQ